MGGGRRDRDAARRGWGRGGRLIGALFPAIAPHFSDVICHSKKHFGGQMFSLGQVPPLINTGQVSANIYQGSAHGRTLACAYERLAVKEENYTCIH